MRRRLLLTLFAATLVAALGSTAVAAAQPPMILLLHGRGWTTGDPASMVPYAADLEPDGYRTRIVAYPLHSVQASIAYVDEIAQQERLVGEPVIAYGLSAGGTVAAALGACGRVDGAIDVIGRDHDLPRPMRPLCQPGEDREPDTTLHAMLNTHAQWPTDQTRARAWLQAHWPTSG